MQLKMHIVITLFLYAFFYLCFCFADWSLRNPFEWIIDLPLYSNGHRFGLLLGWFSYHSTIAVICHQVVTEKNKNKNE